jgi:hypothetical protein
MAVQVSRDDPEATGREQPVTHVMRLRDGRWLAYTELGDPQGVPIFHQHGMPGS